MSKKVDVINIAEWEDAIRDGFVNTYHANRDVASGGVYVRRPDDSIVWIGYYPRSDRFMARRIRANGQLGASKFYHAEDNGWLKALNHQLLSEYRSF